jgi:phosphatidylglycerophosphate synthase
MISMQMNGARIDLGPQQIGKWLVATGLGVVLLGVLFILLGKVGLFKLPGDLQFGGKNWRIFFPIASCIILSIVPTLILLLINYFRR